MHPMTHLALIYPEILILPIRETRVIALAEQRFALNFKGLQFVYHL